MCVKENFITLLDAEMLPNWHYFVCFTDIERLWGSSVSGSSWTSFLILRSRKISREYNYWSYLWHLIRIWSFLSLNFCCYVKHLPCKIKIWTDFLQRYMQNWSLPCSTMIWRPHAWYNISVPSFVLPTETTWATLLM